MTGSSWGQLNILWSGDKGGRAYDGAAAETYEREEYKCWHCKGEGKTVSRLALNDLLGRNNWR